MSRTEKNRGAAMVIVLCVMVVFLALSTTIVLAGSVALSTARNNTIYERGKVQAESLSELFVKDMQRDISENSSSLVRYVRDEIIENNWKAYNKTIDEDSQDSGVVKTLTLDTGAEGDADAQVHQIEIRMYWTLDESKLDPALDLASQEETLSDCDVSLFVDVISTLNDIEYHVKREFSLENTKEATEATNPSHEEYPYKWLWNVEGRSPDRGKESG